MAFRKQPAKAVERGMTRNTGIDDLDLRVSAFVKDSFNSMRPVSSFRQVQIEGGRPAVDDDSD